MRHTRTISLDVDGNCIAGQDRLGARTGVLRLKQDVPIAVYFHLHSAVAVTLDDGAYTAELRLPDERRWRFSAEGAQLRLETRENEPAQNTQQIVLRLSCNGEVTIGWRLERISPA